MMKCSYQNETLTDLEPMSDHTILVADDSGMIRKIIQRELSEADYEVILARNGLEAMSILEWADPLPDLITLDIDMPKMSGFEVIEKIRSEAKGDDDRKRKISEIPVIFVSANDTAENRERGFDLEILDFISKPFAPGKMRTTVANILNSKEQFAGMSALVVEDSPFIRRIIGKILIRHGITVHEVSSGEEALEVLKEERFDIDIVITDYIMPGMSGEELCRTLRGLEQMQQVPIFFVSTVDAKENILNFFKAGASDYLPKPFIEEELRARIVTHLRNRKYVKQLEHLNDKLQYQAEHDALTGAYNRGYMQNNLHDLFMQARQKGEGLCVILLDLDFFKRVNDQYGHAFGDLVLIEFFKIMDGTQRTIDIAARYGGEEFVLLMPDTELEEARELAEYLRRSAEGHIYTNGTIELQVTCSLGVASLQDHKPENPDRLLIMADEALYRAKEKGRNMVEIY